MSSDSTIQIDPPVSQLSETKQKLYNLSKFAVYRALFANLCIGTIKLGCWFFSKSSALLSESIHSFADSFNSICLLVGIKRGQRPADKQHPFGYGLESNIWALFASIFLLVGTGVSLFHGYQRLLHGNATELLENYYIVAIALTISIFFELWAVVAASLAVLEEAEVKHSNKLDAILKSFNYINLIKSPTTKFVWFEDTVALLGVAIAFVAITISKFIMPEHYAHIPDAIASIIIGLLLLSLAFYLIKHNVNFLTGASAKPQTENLIKDIAYNLTGITGVSDLKTMDMGTSGLIVNMEIDVDPELSVKDADDIADRLEEKIREKIKNISNITIEFQAYDTREKWNEKFEKLITEGKKSKVLDKNEANILSKFYDFTETVVKEIMIPRTDVTFIDIESDINELIDLVINSGHTRIPVFKDSIDDIIGIVNAKDILKSLKEHDNNFINLEDLTREVAIIPENKLISDLLNEFNKNKTQLAMVVDEHGGIAGIVTVEDILEELVGEIWDEYDIEVPEVITINKTTLSVYSKMDINDFNEKYDLDFSDEDFQTIGGYVFGLIGREPEVNDQVEDMGIKMKVESIDGHKIVRVLLMREEPFVDKFVDEKEEVEQTTGIEE